MGLSSFCSPTYFLVLPEVPYCAAEAKNRKNIKYIIFNSAEVLFFIFAI